jgi:hypothetical protein
MRSLGFVLFTLALVGCEKVASGPDSRSASPPQAKGAAANTDKPAIALLQPLLFAGKPADGDFAPD